MSIHNFKILITGASGFTGSHLAEYFHNLGYAVHGYDLHLKSSNTAPPALFAKFFTGDIMDDQLLCRRLAEIDPDFIFHSAGTIKAKDPDEYFKSNACGTEALFRAISSIGIKPKVMIPSSSSVYGGGHGSRPISEKFRFRPSTPYAESKVAQENVSLEYFHKYGIPVIITRTFNLVGPGQPTSLVCSRLAYQISLLEKGKLSNPISTGNIDTVRDFIDIRDAVRAYHLLMLHGKHSEVYNVCSSEGTSIRQCLQILTDLAKCTVEHAIDPKHLQATDIPIQTGNFEKLRKLTGWEPAIPLRQSLLDMLEYWRKQP